MTPLPDSEATQTAATQASGAPEAGDTARSGASASMIAIVVVLASMLLIGGGVWAAVSLGGHDPQTVAITVPRGTSVRLAMGEKVEIMPTRLEFYVGDTIEIANDDIVDHSVGPYTVKAGERMRLRYGAPGTYEGYCPLSEGERYEIVVKGS